MHYNPENISELQVGIELTTTINFPPKCSLDSSLGKIECGWGALPADGKLRSPKVMTALPSATQAFVRLLSNELMKGELPPWKIWKTALHISFQMSLSHRRSTTVSLETRKLFLYVMSHFGAKWLSSNGINIFYRFLDMTLSKLMDSESGFQKVIGKDTKF